MFNFGGVIIPFGRMALGGVGPLRFPMASSDAGPSDQHGEGMDMDGWWKKNSRQVAKRFLGEGSGSLPFCFGGRRAMEGVREVLEDT